MDRLPWTRFHWLIVVGLGVSWILDGLEIHLVSLVGPVLEDERTLAVTTAQVASGAGGPTWDFWSLAACRFVAGMGIGGEYAAINSAIDELIPSRYRGRVDIGSTAPTGAGGSAS